MNHLGTRELATERLTLRRFEIEDAENMFYNWANDPEVTKYLTWPAHENVEVTESIVKDWVSKYDDKEFYQWAIELNDLEPEEELLIGKYFKEEYDSDFVFVTHYPSKKRPFYAMDDPADETYTLSFDLLFKGLEITTGGQRIHDYNKLLEKINKRGMETEGMEHYLSAFKHGMPPHGGLGIGLERLTMQLIGEENVREATLFPRDLSRLEP